MDIIIYNIYNILYIYIYIISSELEEEILSEIELKPYLWWRYIDDIFFLWEHGEEKLKKFIEYLNEKHPTTAEWSQTSINFLDVSFTYRWKNYHRSICKSYR